MTPETCPRCGFVWPTKHHSCPPIRVLGKITAGEDIRSGPVHIGKDGKLYQSRPDATAS